MNPEKETPENQIEEHTPQSGGASSSLDDFLKELEAKEKDLQMSSDLVVQIDENDISEADARAEGVESVGIMANRRQYLGERRWAVREFFSVASAWFEMNFIPFDPVGGKKEPIQP